jgi:peptidoglycan hydrolase-like protein with peptidoglycan-binding domain
MGVNSSGQYSSLSKEDHTMKRSILRSSCLAAAVGLLTLAGCASGDDDRSYSSASYPTPQASAGVRDAQQRLEELGLYTGPVDGLWGPDTEDAVARFQRNHRLTTTARLDDETWATLRDASSSQPIYMRDATDIRTIQNRLRQLGYYNGPADGVWGSDTQAALEQFQQARGMRPGEVTVVTIAAMGLDPGVFRDHAVASTQQTAQTAPASGGLRMGEQLEPRVIRGVQRRLRAVGFYSGPADGIWGPDTQQALTEFQKSRGLQASGALTPTTASMLGLNPNDLRSSVASYRR